MKRRRAIRKYERYDLSRSPLAQRPTQRDLAALLNETKDTLNTLARPEFKEQFLVRRTIESNGKARELVYPVARLRAAHERLKFHFSKIIQPSYLMSPRKGRSQRDNALAHTDSCQYLTLDLKQFYPSTTRQMIRSALIDQFAMPPDVAGLIAHLSTADDRACLGSPLTPVLASLVHRKMFDAIAARCAAEDLSYTVWVDDLSISGKYIAGDLVADVRKIVANYGLQSHKLRMRTGNRVVFITGVGIVGRSLTVPSSYDERSVELWKAFQDAKFNGDIDDAASRLLCHLGGIRAIVGNSSDRGRKLANEMNSVRQKRKKAMKRERKIALNEVRRRAAEHRTRVDDKVAPF